MMSFLGNPNRYVLRSPRPVNNRQREVTDSPRPLNLRLFLAVTFKFSRATKISNVRALVEFGIPIHVTYVRKLIG